MHDELELPERRTWQRIITVDGIDWLCEARYGTLVSTPEPICPLCKSDVDFAEAEGDGEARTRARCVAGGCPFEAVIPGHPQHLGRRALDEIEATLRRDARR